MLIIGKNKKQFWHEDDIWSPHENDEERGGPVGPTEDIYTGGEYPDKRTPKIEDTYDNDNVHKSPVLDGDIFEKIRSHPTLNGISGWNAIIFANKPTLKDKLEFLDSLLNKPE